MELFTEDQIEAAFMAAGYKATAVPGATSFLWEASSVETRNVCILEQLVSYVQEKYAANNMTGEFSFYHHIEPAFTKIVFKFHPEAVQEYYSSNLQSLRNLCLPLT